jgi:hypothetical protein
MSTRRSTLRILHLELLESRLAPSGNPWLTENFDEVTPGALPTGWSAWESNAGATVAVGASNGINGSQGLAISSTYSQALAQAWYNTPAAADVDVAADIYVSTLIPAEVIARGSNLGTGNATYYALAVTRGMQVQLLKVVNGTTTVLGEVSSASWFDNEWVQATLQVQGGQVSAQVVRTDTGQYLNSAGQWQTAQAWALSVGDGTITQAGLVGLARPASYTGTVNFDVFSVTNLSTPPPASSTVSENFDTTAVGALPAGWSQFSSTGSTVFGVAAGPALSPPNSLAAVATISQTSAAAWLQAGQPNDVEVSAAVYVNTLIPAEIVARGSSLNTTTPSYYALTLTRGLDLQLIRVVNGTETVLANLQSAQWFDSTWVTATLTVSGSSLTAQVVRADTGQYLNASGQWQAAETSALAITDTAITEGSEVGLARPASYTGTINFDSFSVTALSTVTTSAPPTPVGVFQSFDTTAVGSLPSGWSQYASNGSSPFSVETGTSLSAPNGLQVVANTSSLSASAWLTAAQPADVDVTAAIFLNALIPAEIVARASGLNTATPTYYALSLTRGLDLQLIRVVNGNATVLANLQSASWFSGIWVRASLYVSGTNIWAQVFRVDTAQYLNTAGNWQSTQTWALETTDSAITQAGNVGLVRPPSYTGTLYFDDFSVIPASAISVGPTVSIQAPAANTTLSGVINVEVNATDPENTITSVDFYIDNVLRATSIDSPFTWAFDTTTATNGTHTLTVMVHDLAGNVGQATMTITTLNNTALTTPTIPQHLPNIRIAELAYGGSTIDSTDDTLLENDVDLVISDSSVAQAIASVAPTTPQLAYTNVTNIYGSMLTAWMFYAQQNGIDPESAFYHVTTATPFTGDSSSSQPVNWFWGVYEGGSTLTNYTNQADGTLSGGVPFAPAGQAVYIGYADIFGTINFNLSTLPGAGWSVVVQYAQAIGANGNPTNWATLPITSDSTNGLTQSGQIVFTPPADWKMAIVDGSDPLYYIRILTVSGSAPPTAATILGVDYVDASGVIPALGTAQFAYQSRLFYPGYGQMRFAVNPSSPGFQAFLISYEESYLQSQPDASGLFVDNSDGIPPTTGIPVAESTVNYTTDYAALLNALARAIEPDWIIVNSAGGGTTANTVIQDVQGYFEEFAIQPLNQTYQQFEELAGLVAQRTELTSPSPYAILDSDPIGGSPTDPRTQLATLAYYYMVANPTTTFLDFYGGYAPATSWSQHWSPAAAYNVGQPEGGYSVLTSGADPENSALTYYVFERNYTNALVLYKPLSSNATGSVVGTLDNATATTFTLNGTYEPLLADGTLGAPETSVTLRNGEGAILIKVSG